MRILLSAFACSPRWGSEPGVGWNWAVELAKDHDVTVLTHAYFRAHFEALPASQLPARLHIEYVAVDPPAGRFHEQLLNSQLYYAWWQWFAYRHARQLLRTQSFDLVHHLTLGTFRYPIFLGLLGTPLAVGPLGGGERAPSRFYAGLPLRDRIKERIRDLVIQSFRLDLLSQFGLSKAVAIYCRTPQTLAVLPGYLRRKARIANEIGAPAVDQDTPLPPRAAITPDAPMQVLFAGRLLGWKGVRLALLAVDQARRQRGVPLQFTMIGSGPLSGHLQELARQLELTDHITFLEQIPQADLLARYAQADVFLFPSLHDSGGTVVLEALSRGVPVVCLDLGGPAEFVTPECGTVVSTQGRSVEQVVSALAQALAQHAQASPTQRTAWREQAMQRARTLSWHHQVQRVYQDITQRVSS